jgi:hypothetical protein
MLLLNSRSLFILLPLSTAVLSQNLTADFSNLNPGGTGCVDPSGYLSCYAKNTITPQTVTQYVQVTRFALLRVERLYSLPILAVG